MLFAHDTELNLQAAVALVNSRYSAPVETDRLATTQALAEHLAEFGFSGGWQVTAALLAEVQDLREPLRELFTSERDAMVATVNAWLEETGARPRLVRHDHLDWHIHAEPEGSSLTVQIKAETAMAMVDVIRSDETRRLAVCDDEVCQGVVLDLSRNRSRRYCSTTCGNRAAVAAYRARQG